MSKRAAKPTSRTSSGKRKAARGTANGAPARRGNSTGECAELTVRISPGVEKLPAGALTSLGCTTRPIKAFRARRNAHNRLEALLLDVDFIQRHLKSLNEAELLPGSLLVWDPEQELARHAAALDEQLVYQVLDALPRSANLVTLLRNVHRRLAAERELRRKDAALAELQSLNNELLNVGIALSAEHDNTKLLDLILHKIRQITHADAGSIFLLEQDPESDEKLLRFRYAQNDSIDQDYTEFTMPIERRSIAGFVAITGQVLNIPNAYQIPSSADYAFNDFFDRTYGYWTRSILTVPMFNHQDELIGLVQLLNKKFDGALKLTSAQDADQWVLPFPPENESIVLALASQAGVSLENNLLYEEIENLFAGFVAASVQAIESRDPVTSGHSSRVTAYTVALAEAVNQVETGPYAELHFSAEQLKELRYSGLLHDFGKVGVSEAVLKKAKKLYPDQFDAVMTRFALALSQTRRDFALERLDCLREHGVDEYRARRAEIDGREQQAEQQLLQARDLVVASNEPKVMAEEPSKLLAEVAKLSYRDADGKPQPLLTENEYHKLSIRRGSLDNAEYREIQSHAVHSYNFLQQIPWTRGMERVPDIARGHHEFLNGDGYPRGVSADQIPPETRMMTIADIYDALTANDRPYKPAASQEEALRILQLEAADNHIDADLLEVFVAAGVYKKRDELIR